MARKDRSKPIVETELVAEVRGVYRGQPGVNHPLSNQYRGELLRVEITEIERLLRAPLSLEIIQYFFPDVCVRCGVDLDWIEARLTCIRAGRGCSQATFARLAPIFWRMPHLGWRVTFPGPPWPGYDLAFRDYIRRADGSTIPWPRGTGPRSTSTTNKGRAA